MEKVICLILILNSCYNSIPSCIFRTDTLDDDDVIIEESSKSKQKIKFLQFHTDIRPAYFGTWRKKSKHVTARRPLGQDKVLFDYEVDSADEWEDEEPGESVDSGDDVSSLSS